MPSAALKTTPTRKPRSHSGWSPERRSAHAEAMRRWKPWEKSTGPRTPDGKARSSLNAMQGDPDSALDKALTEFLQAQNRFLIRLNKLIRQEEQMRKLALAQSSPEKNRQNELLTPPPPSLRRT